MNTPVLEVTNLSKNFGGLRALNEVDLTINRQEIVALIGPNGAGKTTFFNCITGIYLPTEGTVQLHLPGRNGKPAEHGEVRPQDEGCGLDLARAQGERACQQAEHGSQSAGQGNSRKIPLCPRAANRACRENESRDARRLAKEHGQGRVKHGLQASVPRPSRCRAKAPRS